MYNNIPIDETLEIVKKKLKNNNESNSFINHLIIIIRNICNQNYFTFSNKYYTQTKGLAMGSPISSILSEVYIQDLENKIILGIKNMHNVLLWNRYVDDILVIYNSTIKDEHLIILNKLNTYNNSIKFTFEEEVNRKINFLDIDIQIEKDNKITTNVYRKETNNNT